MDGKGIILGFIIIFVLGGFLTYMLSPFIDIEEQSQDTWITPFADLLSSIIKGINAVFSGTLHFISMLVSMPLSLINTIFGTDLGGGQGNPHLITISGTGFHDFGSFVGGFMTLDGDYLYEGRIVGTEFWGEKNTARFINENNRRFAINIYLDENHIYPEIVQIVRYNFWGTSLVIYEGVGSPDLWNLFQLVDTDLDFNNNAYGTWITGEPTETFAGAVYDFLERANERIRSSILIIGLLPEAVGIPLIIIVILMIAIGIIKLMPFT